MEGESTMGDRVRDVIAGMHDEAVVPAHESVASTMEAARVFCDVVEAWSRRDWAAMLELAQPSWVKYVDAGLERIEEMFDFFIPESLVSMQTESIFAPAMRTLTAVLEDDGSRRIRMCVNMVREDGAWGWNPTSALRWQDVEQ